MLPRLSPPVSPSAAPASLTRRDALKAGATLLVGLAVSPSLAAARRRKSVIVVGGGIAGLSCAYELEELGHEVVLLEASRRTGGHVKTIHDPLPGGLYADVGAEQFPARPAYAELWDYVEKFGLTPLRWGRNENVYRRIGDRWYSDVELADTAMLRGLGLRPDEANYAAEHGLPELPLLYLQPYLAKFTDEYQPFGLGLDDLDQMLASDILAQEGASDAAIRFSGLGRRSTPERPPVRADGSALYRIWITAILHLRGLRIRPRELYHLQGGNQRLPDAFASRLGDRVRRHCPVTAIEQGSSSVTVRYEQAGTRHELKADYVVCCLSPQALAGIAVSPAWPAAKLYALQNTQMGMGSRVLLQTRTPFWKGDWPSINLQSGHPRMGSVCETAEEVPGERRLLFGTGQPVQTPEETIAAFRSFYPGKAADTIEQCIVHQWWKEEPTCIGCERMPFPLGELSRVWPHIIQPVGRIHFAGAAYDNHWRGMEAAIRSAHRAVRSIHAA